MDKHLRHRFIGVATSLVVLIIGFCLFHHRSTTVENMIEAPSFPQEGLKISLKNPIIDEKNSQVAFNAETTLAQTSRVSTDIVSEKKTVDLPPIAKNKAKTHFLAEKKAHLTPNKKVKSSKKLIYKSTKKPQTINRQSQTTLAKLDDDGLFKLMQSAWVIQLGTFNSKQNALQLVNRLRLQGFPAFIQKFPNGNTSIIRVFVGPEGTQTTARELAVNIKKRLQLKGLVLSYKPLTL